MATRCASLLAVQLALPARPWLVIDGGLKSFLDEPLPLGCLEGETGLVRGDALAVSVNGGGKVCCVGGLMAS